LLLQLHLYVPALVAVHWPCDGAGGLPQDVQVMPAVGDHVPAVAEHVSVASAPLLL
jgi:hypothetical protein